MAAGAGFDELTDEIPDGLSRKKFSGKKIIMIAAPLILIGGSVGIAASLGVFGGAEETAHVENGPPTVEKAIPVVFYDVPEMLVNLNTGEKKSTFLKIRIALEVDRASAVTALDEKLPRVVDNFQVYLRELRVEDLSGSAGMFRLKEELLRRVNQAIAPAKVNDVLFKEMLVQ